MFWRLVFGLGLSVLAALGQQPVITNAKLQQVAATGGLDNAIRTAIQKEAGPFWIGYAVPAVSGEHQSCCWNQDGRGCGLERDRVVPPPTSGPVLLEGSAHVAVLLRVDQGEAGKIRAYTLDCPLDAGGLSFVWLTGVSPSESVAWLSGNGTDSAVSAIAMHAGKAADDALTSFALSGTTEKIRKSALFWLGNSRGRAGYEVVNRVARTDTNDKIREHAIFALSQSRQPEALSAILAIAKEDKSPRVRGQALFWLSQKASRQASAAITSAIEQDPDTEVKKKAVFALTQMSPEEGVPMLIRVARNNANPAVRKQAMFWLGQSKDPRAIRFFEEILTK